MNTILIIILILLAILLGIGFVGYRMERYIDKYVLPYDKIKGMTENDKINYGQSINRNMGIIDKIAGQLLTLGNY